MTRDFKKDFRQFYIPKKTPYILTIPAIGYLAVDGKGELFEGAEYKSALDKLARAMRFIKKAPTEGIQIPGWYDFVVPPAEILIHNFGSHAENLKWTLMMRLPEYVKEGNLKSLLIPLSEKRSEDYTPLHYLSYEEGFAVQVLHKGSHLSIRGEVRKLAEYAEKYGYKSDTKEKPVHQIILSTREEDQSCVRIPLF